MLPVPEMLRKGVWTRGCEDADPGTSEVKGSADAACSASDGELCLVSANPPYLLTAKPSQGPVFRPKTE